MAVLAAAQYDPSTRATKSLASLLAMTAIDATNLALSFTAPASGNVLVHMSVPAAGNATPAGILLGVLDGSTIRMRLSPVAGLQPGTLSTSASPSFEAVGVVTGLTAGQSYTWDAAYSVDVVASSANLEYGGPNDTSGADAEGAFVFEVWDAANCLAAKLYDPSTAVSDSITSLKAMTAFDTTNLRNTFTAPASGNVMWRIHAVTTGSTTYGQILLGVLNGSTVVGRASPQISPASASSSSTRVTWDASGVITGLTGGNSYSFDAAYAVQVVGGTGAAVKYGGPNDTTSNNAWGALAYEIWAA